MSKSKKNIIDPESMIKIYGADAVRWFILSDSPPDKDVQWSNQGVNAAYKFLQKIWNLNSEILGRSDEKNISKETEDEFNNIFNNYILKITNLIENFQLNVAVANVYEIYHLIKKYMNQKISNTCLKNNLSNFMSILIPFTPHLANECLEKLGVSKIESWPEIRKESLKKQKTKIAIQINGKTREVIEVEKSLTEEKVVSITKKSEKIRKILTNKKIMRIIFVKDKIINYLIK